MSFARVAVIVAGVFSTFAGLGPAKAGPNLVRDGGFEMPVAPNGGFIDFATGQRIGPWLVVGAQGDVALIDKNYVAAGGFACPPRSGKQWIDLTARSFTPTGVRQQVPTTGGRDYLLTFYVGNIFDAQGQLGKTSTVNVFVGGKKLMSATNRAGRGKKSVVWKKFTATFTAKGPNTTLAFLNGDPSGDDANGLDGVSLIAAP